VRAQGARLAVVLVLGLTTTACGGDGGGDGKPAGDLASDRPLATGLMLLPDEPALRRHVLVADLERLRAAYPTSAGFREALLGVWLPDALASAGRALWDETFGLRLGDISFLASAGFHPAEVAVAQGEFSPERIRGALRRSGYRAAAGQVLARGADGSFDPGTEAGRLALSSLNRVVASPSRVTAASTSALIRAALSPSPELATNSGFAAAADALDPITAAIVLDANLVRPPSGIPTTIIPSSPARLVAVGIDDLGPRRRTVKIALVYESAEQARSDAAVIERELPSATFPGGRGAFADIAPAWRVSARGTAIVVTALLPPGGDPWTWRALVESGDLGSLVRPPQG
jgi:hypothetical protein